MQHLWLIPAFPLLGFLVNGILGRRLSNAFVNAVAIVVSVIALIILTIANRLEPAVVRR